MLELLAAVLLALTLSASIESKSVIETPDPPIIISGGDGKQ